jgi:hypothetical protein
MNAAIFLVAAIGMMFAVGGRPRVATLLFAVGLVAAVVWLVHHMTDPLPLAF